MYDAIVVGARCAGAPTAMLLGRKGHKVLLLDRSTFPSDLAPQSEPSGSLASRSSKWEECRPNALLSTTTVQSVAQNISCTVDDHSVERDGQIHDQDVVDDVIRGW
jgi:2-polyprenyl-6-methoxyphenol hydroxylase-like FAD-dependent oxidoreductase